MYLKCSVKHASAFLLQGQSSAGVSTEDVLPLLIRIVLWLMRMQTPDVSCTSAKVSETATRASWQRFAWKVKGDVWDSNLGNKPVGHWSWCRKGKDRMLQAVSNKWKIGTWKCWKAVEGLHLLMKQKAASPLPGVSVTYFQGYFKLPLHNKLK